VLVGDLFEDRRDHLAGAAPLGPEVDENGPMGPKNLGLERGVTDGFAHIFGAGEGCALGTSTSLKSCV
jgi:hypothetical protein